MPINLVLWFVGTCTPRHLTGPAWGAHGSQCLVAARSKARLGLGGFAPLMQLAHIAGE